MMKLKSLTGVCGCVLHNTPLPPQTFRQFTTKPVMVKVVWAQLMGIGKYDKNNIILLRALGGDPGTLSLLG